MNKLIISILFAFCSLQVFSNQIKTQTIRGTVLDEDSRQPLIGVHVKVWKGDSLFGAITDLDGTYSVSDVPIGRLSVSFTYLGYEPKQFNELMLTAAKQLVLDIQLTESVESLDAVTVEAYKREQVALNEMATVSAKTFSVEETGRYAGSLSDPARAVTGFAGVIGSTDGNNDIVVRGNSPRGIHWRIEGQEAPNPNHFATEGGTGGPISILNANMLANSDFFSGAFPAEYGNALSGVFDINLRKGNNEKRETAFGISAIGLEGNTEGPINRDNGSSYNVNYRYSSLDLLDGTGIVDFGGIPKYQDGAFKLHFPTSNAGVFSIYGLGGKSGIQQEERDSTDQLQWTGTAENAMGVVGVTHVISTGERSYIKSGLALSGTLEDWNYSERHLDSMREEDAQRFQNTNARAYVTYNLKVNARHKATVRLNHTQAMYRYSADYYDEEVNELLTALADSGQSNYSQLSGSWKFRPSDRWTIIGGVHSMRFDLTNEITVEPRLGANFDIDKKHSVKAGLGWHSRMEPLITYLANDRHPISGRYYQPNNHLAMNKAFHGVLGFSKQWANGWRASTEVYYQYLYDIPAGIGINKAKSALNAQGFAGISPMLNTGLGRNYGIELTVDRPLKNGFYMLATGSLYSSEYSNDKGKTWHDTRYNGGYAGNILLGKEWITGRKNEKSRVLGVNLKTSLIGGMRYREIDLAASQKAGREILVSPYFTQKADDLFKQNVAGYIRWSKSKVSHEFKIDIQNVTNYTPVVDNYYNAETETIEGWEALGLLPNLGYTLRF